MGFIVIDKTYGYAIIAGSLFIVTVNPNWPKSQGESHE